MADLKSIIVMSVFASSLILPRFVWCGPISIMNPKSPSNIPAEYQSAISKALPGYQILNPSEIFLDKDEIGPDLYDKVKSSPSVIVGSFNNDHIDDFVALVRNSTTRTYSWSPHGKFIDRRNIEKYDVYTVNLAVCYGLANGKFDCVLTGEAKPRTFGEVYLPADFANNKTNSGEYVCTDLELHVQAGGMHQYRDDYGKEHSNIDDLQMPYAGNTSRLSVTKFQENLRFDLVSKPFYLRCARISEAAPTPEANSKLPTAVPTVYQNIISAAFPGYRILGLSEILLNKKELGTKLYDKVKASPGLIVGKFNDDNISDFAALIRNSTIKTYDLTPQGEVVEELYKAHLAVCYGSGDGKFDCSRIPGAFNQVGLFTDWVLNKTGPGKYFCASSKEIDLSNDREPDVGDNGDAKPKHFTVKTDVINLFTTSNSWAATKYIYQSDDTFLKCIESSD